MWGRALVSLSLLALPAFGIMIGEVRPAGFTTLTTNPQTLIHMARPAVEAGTVKSVTLVWFGAPVAGCNNAVKVKFFRRFPGDEIRVVSSHGPFNVQNGVNTYDIPIVDVAVGDWIGLTQVAPGCGGVSLARDDTALLAQTFSDPATTVTGLHYFNSYAPNIAATTTVEHLQGYFVVAGSLRGGAGSQFKTAAQLTNIGNNTITGRLVFHPAGVPAQATDPSIAYSLAPGQTQSYDDVVQAMGASGLGTMDLIVATGYPPDVSMRIYNDEGAGGTSGLTEEMRTIWDAHRAFHGGTITIPADLANFRLNVGVRALREDVQMAILLFDPAGGLVHVADRTFAANTFNQESAAQFAQATSVPAGGRIQFQLNSGTAFVYGAVTDNRTNDPNLRFATKY